MDIIKIVLSVCITLGASGAFAKESTVSFLGDWQKLGRAEVVHGKDSVTVANGTLANLKPVGDCEYSFSGRMPKGSERVQIWGAIRVKDGENRYVVGLRGMPEPQLSFARYAPDNEAMFMGFSPLDPPPSNEQWYTIRVVTIGNRFLVFLNDELAPRLDVEDKAPLWTDGGVGVGGGWLPAEFKDVTVTPLTDERRAAIVDKSVVSKLGARATKINFQQSGLSLVQGWLVDDGSVYNGERGYGWDAKIGTRKRDKSKDLLFDSLVTIAHEQQEASFMMDLPNGEYLFSLQAGDPGGSSAYSLYLQDEPDVAISKKQDGGTPSVVRRTVRVNNGKLKLHFVRNGVEGISLNWLAVEKKEDVSRAEWDAAVASAKPCTEKEDQRVAERAAYKPAKVASLPEIRGEISLDGRWLFMPDQDLAGVSPIAVDLDDKSWHTIAVPSLWTPALAWLYGESGMPNLQGLQSNKGPSDKLRAEVNARADAQTFDWRNTKTGWYRHYLELPENLNGRQFTLEFGAIAKISEVWVNGIRVGSNTGMFREVECDITKAVKPGRNLIAVCVVGIPDRPRKGSDTVETVAVTVNVTSEMLTSLPHGMVDNSASGIWQPVKLLVTDPTRVSSVFIQPQIDSAVVDVELVNSTADSMDVELSYIIRDVKKRSVLTSGKPVKVTVPANGTGTTKLQTVKVEPQLWSPQEPNLYILELTVSRDGKLLDRQHTRFGFRTFAVHDGKLMLNGKPYWLRGGNHIPALLCPNDAEIAKRFIGMARDGNVMITRSHGLPFTDTWFDAADEYGMGVSYEGTWPWLMIKGEPPNAELLKVWKDEFSSLIRRYRNHPSLLFWTVNNEMNFAEFDRSDVELLKRKWAVLDDMIRAMRVIDPTHPIVAYSGYLRQHADISTKEVVLPNKFDDGDIDDIHTYNGWYNPTFFNLFHGELGHAAFPVRPMISQEISTGYPRNDDWPSRSYQFNRYVPEALVGQYAMEQNDPAIFMTRQAFMTKELTEVIRRKNRKECHGLMPFAYMTWFTDVWDAKNIRPKVTYYEIGKAMQPVLVSAELTGRHFYTCTVAVRRVCLINDAEDTKDLSAGKLVWEILNGKTVLSRGEQDTPPVAYYANEWMDVTFKMPETLSTPRVDAKLVLKYNVGGKVVSENTYDLLLASREWSEGDNSNPIIQVFDPGKKLGDLFAGRKTEVIGADLEGGKLAVIADLDEFVKVMGGIDKLVGFVEAGGHAMLLHPGKALVKYFPDQIKSYRSVKGEIVSLAIPESPLFNGIEPLDLAWFEMGKGNLPYACSGTWQIDRTCNDVSAPAHQCDLHSPTPTRETIYQIAGAPLVEIRLGKGVIIASEMMLSAKDVDPVAGRLMSNMIAVSDH